MARAPAPPEVARAIEAIFTLPSESTVLAAMPAKHRHRVRDIAGAVRATTAAAKRSAAERAPLEVEAALPVGTLHAHHADTVRKQDGADGFEVGSDLEKATLCGI